MYPCAPPAKKANIVRLLGASPNDGWPSVPKPKLISGSETSVLGLKPSVVLALQRTLMKFLDSSGLASETSGA